MSIYKINSSKDIRDGYHSSFSEYDNFYTFTKTEKDAKNHFKSIFGLKKWRKFLTIERVEPSKEIKTVYSWDNMVYLLKDDKIIFSWNNSSNCDYPEDLTWDREIGAVFDMAYKLGREHVLNELDS